jgi:osmotically-inducible protein OsmY
MKSNPLIRLGLAVVVGIWAVALACRTTQSPERQVQDAGITGEVKAKLASEVRPATLTNIEVNTTNGVVTLAGQVRSEQEKEAAEQVARSIAGVVDVNNNLQVAAEAGRQ